MTNSLTPETTLYLFELLTVYYQKINSIEDYFRIKKQEKLLQYGI
jgi:hypothetical protein